MGVVQCGSQRGQFGRGGAGRSELCSIPEQLAGATLALMMSFATATAMRIDRPTATATGMASRSIACGGASMVMARTPSARPITGMSTVAVSTVVTDRRRSAYRTRTQAGPRQASMTAQPRLRREARQSSLIDVLVPVADAEDGQQPPRPGRIVLYFLPETPHMDGHSGEVSVLPTPDALE